MDAPAPIDDPPGVALQEIDTLKTITTNTQEKLKEYARTPHR